MPNSSLNSFSFDKKKNTYTEPIPTFKSWFENISEDEWIADMEKVNWELREFRQAKLCGFMFVFSFFFFHQ